MVCLHAVQGNGRPYWRKGKLGECALGFALFWGVERDFSLVTLRFVLQGCPWGAFQEVPHAVGTPPQPCAPMPDEGAGSAS
jgi:hypothetical protein